MKNKYSRFTLPVLIAVYALMILYAMTMQAGTQKKNERTAKQLAQMRSGNPLSQQGNARETDRRNMEFESALLAHNADAAGWITIPGTPVDYPVMQTGDNETYLHTDFLGNANAQGALFFDYECSPAQARTENLIVYGHMAKGSQMFGSLKYYREPAFYAEHSAISLYLIGQGEQAYEIISVFIANAYLQETEVRDYRQIFFESEEEYLNWQTHFINQSLYGTGAQARAEKNTLTLSTCAYDFEDARLVILAIEK